ncbi:MAG: lysophospholipase [Limisphaerales bacterium]|jgi:lysophospholipase
MRFSQDRVEKLNCSDGVKRDIHIWEPQNPKALILAIHGGLAHGGDYLTPALWFKQHGFATISWDQNGHDKKERVFIPSFEVFLDDVELMLNWLKGHFGDLPIIIMGHSMGALIATHFGLRRWKNDEQIKGFVFSSPYYVNAIKTPALLVKLAGVLSSLTPNLKVPLDDFTDFLTHDKAITARHREDESDHIRATSVSARFGNELLKAQEYISRNIARWDHPTFIVIAGSDKLADAEGSKKMAAQMNQEKLTLQFRPDNYHENFNELDREAIYADVLTWIEQKI